MWLRVLLVLLLSSSMWAEAASFVQGKLCAVGATASDTVSCTFDSPTAAGHIIVASAAYQTGTVTAITFRDNTGGQYASMGDQLGAPVAGAGASIAIGRTGLPGTTTVTATYTNSEQPDIHGLCILEYRHANLSTFQDVTASNSQTTPGSGTDAVTSTAMVTTADGETIIGALWNVETVDVNINAGTVPNAWTSRAAQTTGTVQRGLCEEFIQSAAGSIAATGALSSGTTANTVAFGVALENRIARGQAAAREEITTTRLPRQ